MLGTKKCGAVVVIGIGAGMIGPRVEVMAAANTRDDLLAAAVRVRRAGTYERTGMLGMLALMVAMHAGY